MATITEAEFDRICAGILADRESIFRHNPVGTEEETLLWMLLGCLISYLGLSEIETPCFSGVPTAETYRNAISTIIKGRMAPDFSFSEHLDRFSLQ